MHTDHIPHALAPKLRQRLARGFTLIEVMIVVAIIGILAAIALPSYRDYILRGQLVDATSLLAAFRGNMERYYQDNRRYTAIGTAVPPCDISIPVLLRKQGNFEVTCVVADGPPPTFVLTATGTGPANGFVYTVTQDGIQATTAVGASGWGATPVPCWIMKKGQTC